MCAIHSSYGYAGAPPPVADSNAHARGMRSCTGIVHGPAPLSAPGFGLPSHICAETRLTTHMDSQANRVLRVRLAWHVDHQVLFVWRRVHRKRQRCVGVHNDNLTSICGPTSTHTWQTAVAETRPPRGRSRAQRALARNRPRNGRSISAAYQWQRGIRCAAPGFTPLCPRLPGVCTGGQCPQKRTCTNKHAQGYVCVEPRGLVGPRVGPAV